MKVKSLVCSVRRVICASCVVLSLSGRAAESRSYNVTGGDAVELRSVLVQLNADMAADADHSTYVVTLGRGVYDLSEVCDTPMCDTAAGGILFINNTKTHKVTLQGDAAVPKDEVVLDGKGLGRVLRIWGYGGTSTVKNLTVRGGYSTASDGGGGVSLESWGVFAFRDCAFIGNVATKGAGGAVGGSPTDKVHFYGCDFTENVSLRGGGATPHLNGEMLDCTFTRNATFGEEAVGGAVRVTKSGFCISNCTFDSNCITGRYEHGGALAIGEAGRVLDCTFTNNWVGGSNQRGGAIRLGTAKKYEISGCRFFSNRSNAGHHGGAISSETASPTAVISDCHFCRNTAQNGNGGAISGFAGLVTNCTFVGNAGRAGGGVSGVTNVVGCVFTGNSSAVDSTTDGGGAARNSSLWNCVLTNNTAIYRFAALANCHVYRSSFRGNKTNYDNQPQVAVASDFTDCDLDGSEAKSAACEYDFRTCTFDRCLFRRYSQKGIGQVSLCATNCLFVSNFISRVCNETSSTLANALVNCTLVGNMYNALFRYSADGGTAQTRVVNSLFVDNRSNEDGRVNDLGYQFEPRNAYEYNVFYASHDVPGEGNVNRRVQTKYDPRLMGARDPTRPYAPRRRSPLNGAGLVMDWMADAKDFAGSPRLTDETVAIGAYETTEELKGLMLIFR